MYYCLKLFMENISWVPGEIKEIEHCREGGWKHSIYFCIFDIHDIVILFACWHLRMAEVPKCIVFWINKMFPLSTFWLFLRNSDHVNCFWELTLLHSITQRNLQNKIQCLNNKICSHKYFIFIFLSIKTSLSANIRG